MERISELLDDYGWAESDDRRRQALFSWMNETTSEIVRLKASIKYLESKAVHHANLFEKVDNQIYSLDGKIDALEHPF